MLGQYLGCYREFAPPFHSDVSLRDDLAAIPQPSEERIVARLKAGHQFIYRMGPFLKDVLEGNETTGWGHVLTDGTWVWRDDLEYYVRTYHLRLPTAAVRHMEANGWVRPRIDDAILIRLEEEHLEVSARENGGTVWRGGDCP